VPLGIFFNDHRLAEGEFGELDVGVVTGAILDKVRKAHRLWLRLRGLRDGVELQRRNERDERHRESDDRGEDAEETEEPAHGEPLKMTAPTIVREITEGVLRPHRSVYVAWLFSVSHSVTVTTGKPCDLT